MGRKPLGCSTEGIDGLMCLKFGTRIIWVNPWGCFFFHFLKIFIFRLYLRHFWTKICCKTIDAIAARTIFMFCFSLGKCQGGGFSFFENFYFQITFWTFLAQNLVQNLWAGTGEGVDPLIFFFFVFSYSWAKCPGVFSIFRKFVFLGHIWGIFY